MEKCGCLSSPGSPTLLCARFQLIIYAAKWLYGESMSDLVVGEQKRASVSLACIIWRRVVLYSELSSGAQKVG